MTKVEITFLGTTASIPTKERNHPAIYLKYIGKHEHYFLFDCGEGTQRQIFKAGLNFMRIEAVFITHWHADHFAGLFGLLETMTLEKRKEPLYVFGPEADKFVNVLLSLGHARRPFKVVAKPVEYHGSSEEVLIDDDEYKISSIPVSHGVPAVAFVFKEKDRIKIDKKKLKELGLPSKGKMYGELKEKGEIVYKGKKIKLEDVSFVEKGKKIVYTGDTKYCHNLVKVSKDADCLISDSTFFEDKPEDWLEGRHHMTVRDAVRLAKEAGVKKLVLTHISRRYPSEKFLKEKLKEVLKEEPVENVIIAKDFMKVVI